MGDRGPRLWIRVIGCAVAAAFVFGSSLPAVAQIDPQPNQRQLRTYIPPDQLVSFAADTPFDQFLEFVNPLFLRVTGKSVVDLTGRAQPIGINVSALQFIDAFELVLSQAGLNYRETDRYFLVEPFVEAAGGAPTVQPVGGAVPTLPAGTATAADREVRIDAIIFELNHNRLREVGTNTGVIFGEGGGGGGQGGGQQGGGQGGQGQQGLRFFLNTESFFDQIADVIEGPDRVDFSDLVSLFRFFESIGIGETVSSPSVVVRSGKEGRIQSGSDIPVTLQDFAGNTVTQYIPTGVIINAKPALIVDDSDEPGNEPVEFIHLIVDVERSSGRLGGEGIIIDKNQATTEVLLLDGEQTLIGGLYSTEESVARRGIPILMDIPLLNYFFSYRTRSTIDRELIIVLQARLLDPLRQRANRPFDNDLFYRERNDIRQRLNRTRPRSGEEAEFQRPLRERQ